MSNLQNGKAKIQGRAENFRRRSLKIVLVALPLLILPAVPRAAAATTGLVPQSSSSPTPGVESTSYLDTDSVIHVTHIFGGAPVVVKAVPTSPHHTATVATLCRRVNAVACINGDFFDRNGVPLGGELVDGVWLRPPTPIQQQVWVDWRGQFSIGDEPSNTLQSLGATKYAILSPGHDISIPEHDNFADGRHARTLVGWNESGDRFFVTVDQNAKSKGMSLAQSAVVMRELGATTAVNEDGGSSSQMVVRGVLLGGSTGRRVANIWAVVAGPAPTIPAAPPASTNRAIHGGTGSNGAGNPLLAGAVKR